MAVGSLGASSGKALYTQEFTVWDTNLAANWTPSTPASGYVWYDVLYANSKYVAVGQKTSDGFSYATSSTDGVSWTTPVQLSGSPSAGMSVAYGNSTWVAVLGGTSTSSVAYTSSDGLTWTQRSIGTLLCWTNVVYHANSGLFIAIAHGGGATSTGTYATSPNGITWTTRTAPSSTVWSGIATDGTRVVIVAGGSKINGPLTPTGLAYSSTDGINWSSASLPSNTYWVSITYGAGMWIAVSQGQGAAALAYSTTGTSWNSLTLPAYTVGYPCEVGYANGSWIIVMGYQGITTTQVMYSPSGSTGWVSRSTMASGSWYALTSNGTTGLAMGANCSAIAATYTGNTWTAPSGVYTVNALAVGGGGSGGGSSSTACAGGGGGGRVLLRPVSVTPGSTYAITIGAGGVAATASAMGNAGGSTTFGSLLTADGGGAGGGGGNPGGAGANGGGGSGATSAANGSGGGAGAGGPGGSGKYNGTSGSTAQLGGLATVVGGSSGGNGMGSSAQGGDGGLGLYGFGGGGGGAATGTVGLGAHGGGRGGSPGVDAIANSGGGGGGSYSSSAGGAGGSGYLRLEWWA